MCQSRIVEDCEILVPGKIDLSNSFTDTPMHHRARMHDVAMVAPDVATFQLSLEEGTDYLAGQYFLVQMGKKKVAKKTSLPAKKKAKSSTRKKTTKKAK